MNNQPAKDENTQYEFRCHQCGKEFMAVGILMDGFASSSFLLIKPKECPNCGSIRIMPVLFEDDKFQVEKYQRMWELKEKNTKKEEKRQ